MWILIGMCVFSLILVLCIVALPHLAQPSEGKKGSGFYVVWIVVGIVVVFLLYVIAFFIPGLGSWSEMSWGSLKEFITK